MASIESSPNSTSSNLTNDELNNLISLISGHLSSHPIEHFDLHIAKLLDINGELDLLNSYQVSLLKHIYMFLCKHTKSYLWTYHSIQISGPGLKSRYALIIVNMFNKFGKYITVVQKVFLSLRPIQYIIISYMRRLYFFRNGKLLRSDGHFFLSRAEHKNFK